jgi:hypothetical protein
MREPMLRLARIIGAEKMKHDAKTERLRKARLAKKEADAARPETERKRPKSKK